MVELGNHQGRPPGGQQPLSEMGSDLGSVSLSSSLLDHWINQDIASLDFLDCLCSVTSTRTNDVNSSSDLSGSVCIKDESTAVVVQETEKLVMQMKENYQLSGSLPHWGFPMDVDSLKLDDVFQVEQSDLVQSPTLAELNGDKEPFFELEFGDLDFDMPVILPDIKGDNEKKDASSKNEHSNFLLKLQQKHDSIVMLKSESTEDSMKTEKGKYTVEEEEEEDEDVKYSLSRGKVASSLPLAIPGVSVRSRQRTYSSTELSVTSSVSSNDEGFGSQAEDTDAEFQLPSDTESLACDEESLEGSPLSPSSSNQCKSIGNTIIKNTKPGVHKKRYFWQYNIQSKGPKGPRMPMNSAQCLDPHILNDVTDPVFSAECHLEGVKHAGKARRGDGNDLTPNPRKLHNIGVELKSLNRMINELSSACDSPGNVKPKSRKEKNKLASRSCRLKKKAQHEANKLKLFGLQQEHCQLMAIMDEIKGFLNDVKCKNLTLRACQQSLQKILERRALCMVAGHTAEYVNRVLEKVAAGNPVPGLEDLQP